MKGDPDKQDEKTADIDMKMADDDGVVDDEDDDDFEVVPLRLLKRSDDEQMQKLFGLLRNSPHVIDWFLGGLVFPTFMRHQEVSPYFLSLPVHI